MAEYQPGVCNIGRKERRKRRVLGSVSLVAALGVVGYALVSGQPDGFVLPSFALFFGAAMGFVQDRLGFCAGFAAMARYEVGDGDAGSVTEREALKRDRRRAAQVVAVSVVAALAATAAAYGAAVVL